jgi:hypothetical protein
MIIVGLILVVGLSVTYVKLVSYSPSDIDGIQCNQMEQAVFHIHTHLDVHVEEQHQTAPSLIGIIPNSCLYWLHTHESTGIIHIEAPKYQIFTQGQFMDIWSKSLEKSEIPSGIPKVVYVNGKEINQDYREIQLVPTMRMS